MSLAKAMTATFGTYSIADFLSNFLQASFEWIGHWLEDRSLQCAPFVK